MMIINIYYQRRSCSMIIRLLTHSAANFQSKNIIIKKFSKARSADSYNYYEHFFFENVMIKTLSKKSALPATACLVSNTPLIYYGLINSFILLAMLAIKN